MFKYMLLTLALIGGVATAEPTGIELIQQCRLERTKALAATNDLEFAEQRYLECLNRG